MLKNSKKAYLIILICIVLLGGILRLYNLGENSFWPDELNFVEAAKSMSSVGEPLLPSGYPYSRTPLLTYSVMVSFKIFGVSEFSSRLPAALFGIISILLMFIIGRGFFNARIGLIAAIFLAFAPFAIGWGRICRMYSLFQLLYLAGFYFFFKGFEPGDVNSNQFGRQNYKLPFDKISNLLRKWNIKVK